jgi:hypothetical protein
VVNYIRSLNHLAKIPNRNYKPHVLFVDFKAAYDTVDRNILYEKLRRKNILNEREIQLLKFLHDNMKIQIGEITVNSSRGVPQGMISSPMLFNIYSEEILDELCTENVFVRMYADDLLVIVEGSRNLTVVAEKLSSIVERLKLKINPKKSGVMICGYKPKEYE